MNVDWGSCLVVLLVWWLGTGPSHGQTDNSKSGNTSTLVPSPETTRKAARSHHLEGKRIVPCFAHLQMSIVRGYNCCPNSGRARLYTMCNVFYCGFKLFALFPRASWWNLCMGCIKLGEQAKTYSIPRRSLYHRSPLVRILKLKFVHVGCILNLKRG